MFELIDDECDVEGEEYEAFDSSDPPVGQHDRDDHDADRRHYPNIEGQDFSRHLEGRNDRKDADDQQNVENIGADNVAQRDVGVISDACDNRSGQLGKRGAEGDQRQADHCLGDARRTGDRDRAVDQKI